MKFKLAASFLGGLTLLSSFVNCVVKRVSPNEFFAFKQLMMYFNEPLLQGAKAKGFDFDGKRDPQSFEGAESLEMAKTVCQMIKNGWTGNDDIKLYANYLEEGIKVMEDKSIIIDPTDKWDEITTKAKILQKNLIDALKSMKKLVLPFGWVGKEPHAINLIMEKSYIGDTYNLIVINSGDGLNYHYAGSDPNKVYPWLNQLWIEFKNIPEAKLFDDDAWFAHMMIKLQHPDTMQKNELASKSAATYFYGSILSNFKENVPKDHIAKSNKLSPAQRSGSCTLSSLMASYLYYSKDDESYNYNRVMLGHELLGKFLSDHATKPDFKALIEDGFDLVSRKLFQATSSALAQQLFTYLEVKMPKVFKNSALIGAKRSEWIRSGKGEAINELKKDHETLALLKDTVDLCIKIIEFLEKNPINPKTNLIDITAEMTSIDKNGHLEPDKYFGSFADPNVNFYKLLEADIQRPHLEDLSSFKEINARLKKCSEMEGGEIQVCALDAFRMTKKNWWSFLDDASTSEEALDFLILCSKLTYAYLSTTGITGSFDDIVLLAHLQIGTWKSALVYDERFATVKLGLKNFAPPLIIHRVLSKQLSNKLPVTSGAYANWLIKTSYTARNLDELAYLLEEYLNLGPKSETAERFLGPGDFLGISTNVNWKAKDALNKISKTVESKRIYELMMGQSGVKKAIEDIKKVKSGKSEKWTKELHADYQIFMTSIDQKPNVENLFPHFYRLWDQMIWSYHSLGLKPLRSSYKPPRAFKKSDEQDDVDTVKFGSIFEGDFKTFNGQKKFGGSGNSKPIEECFKLKTSSDENIFYKLRHSQALSPPANVINFESWLNYVKGAADPSIFDHPYFLYLSEILLNLPRIDLVPPYKIDRSMKATYPEGFTKRHVKAVFDAFMRLINMDLNYIISKQGRLDLAEKTKLIKRPVNIAIPLVKFIGRVDHDNLISGRNAAILLAKIYMSFYRFSPLLSSYGLENTDISTVNLVLAQITDLPIRNAKTFLENLKILPDNNKSNMELFRKSLSRVHWFITKMFYIKDTSEFSPANDLYTLGFIYHPIAKNESQFMTYLLKSLFLVKHDANLENWKTIEFFKNGDIVRALTSTSDPASKIMVAVQLSSGKVVKNGNLIVEMGALLNDSTFQAFFPQEDKNAAVKGEITKIGSTVLYTLNDYKMKDNLIVFVCPANYNCSAFRKYKYEWYIWIKETGTFKTNIKYDWIHGHKLFLSLKNTGTYKRRALVIADAKEKPLLILETKENWLNYINEIYIDDFADSSYPWKLLKFDEKKESDKLEKHLKTFTDTDMLLALEESNGLLAVIYPGLRLKEDPDRPLTLLQLQDKSKSKEFVIKNSPGLVVVEQQSITNGIGIKGTLIVRNSEKQLFIMAPLHGRKSKNECKELRFVEMIPIVDMAPAPQTRLQRLLLAFYGIRARDYDMAGKLLQPFKSIDQNEAFAPKELEVFTWIITHKGGGPEADALKLVAYSHMLINETKFPLEYVEEKDDVSEEGLQKKARSKSLKDVQSSINSILRNYLLSVRELPERLYVHKIVPEFLNSKIFANLLNSLNVGNKSVTVKSNPTIIQCDCDSVNKMDQLIEDKISPKTIFDFFSTLHKDPKDATLARYLRVKSKHMHKRFGDECTSTENEMIIYCASKDLDSWKDLAKEYVEYCNASEKPEEKTTALENAIKKKMKDCSKDYGEEFKSFAFPTKPVKTKAVEIIDTFKSDLKGPSTDEVVEFNELKLVTEEDKTIFKDISKVLEKLVDVDKSSQKIDFQDGNIDISKVLKKLANSIAEFVQQKGKAKVFEIKLESSTIEFLKDFNFYLESRMYEINTIINDMTAELNGKTEIKGKLDTEAHVMEKLTRYMHRRKAKTFKSLHSCYQKKSLYCVEMKFPQLEMEVCKNLLKETLDFYSNVILLEFMNTLFETSERFIRDTLKGQKVTVDDISLFLDEAGKIGDFNERLMEPIILNFEYRSKRYRLRKEQVNDIEMLTFIDRKTGLFQSAVIQRMMAAGKTLVLGTISVVQKALDNTKLSILVPPSSLYQSNLSAMQARTYAFFKTKGHNFIFPRFQFSTDDELSKILIPFLLNIAESLKSAMEAREYYVLSPDSLQAFLNAYIEMLNYAAYKYNDKVKKALGLYAEIYGIFKTKGSIILDEIDMTMDPKKELNFPTIENEPFNLLAATLMTDLIEFSVFDDKVLSIGLDIFGNNQSSLTSEDYEKYLARLIEYIDGQFKDPKSLWSERLLDKDVKDILTPAKIIEFFKNPDIAHMKDWIKELCRQERQRIADTLIIIKVQLYQNLKASLNASANLNYGAAGSNRANVLYAIPFLAANTPSPSSEFADRWETLNKTLLMLASVPCTRIIAKNMISYVRKNAIRETSLDVTIEQTQTSKTLETLIPGIKLMSLNDQDDAHVEMMHKALKNRSPTAVRLLFSYALDEIFSEMKFPVEQITSNALNMASMFGSVQGYSGTIDNVNILPREVVAGAYENHMENEKNNGGISFKLANDNLKTDVYQLTDDDLKKDIYDIIDAMVTNGMDSKYKDDLSAIIDAGAFFKNFKNRQVAEAIHKKFYKRIDAVLYYDEESNQVQFIRPDGSGTGKFTVGYITNPDPEGIQKATQVDLSRRFTFYDQRHITGSDILQPKTARALMTVGTRVLLRDILQGTLRMRQFMTSQKVHLVTSVAAANFYLSKCKSDEKKRSRKVNVTDLLTLGAFNEDEKQQVENEKLAYIKIDSEVRRFVMDELTRAITTFKAPEKIISVWFAASKGPGKTPRDLFIRFIKENPIDWMVTPVKKDSATVLENYTAYWLRKLRDASAEVKVIDNQFDLEDSATPSGVAFNQLKEVFKTLTKPQDATKKNMDTLLAFLREKIVERGALSDGGCEVQMQVFTQNLTEFDLEKLSKTYGSNPKPFTRSPFDMKPLISSIKAADEVTKPSSKNTGVMSLNEILFAPEFTDIYKSVSRAALLSRGKRIFVSTDLLQIIDVPPQKPMKIFSRYTWEGSHILVQVIPKMAGIRMTLLSTESANEVRNFMQESTFVDRGSTFWLCDLSGTVTLTTDPETHVGENIIDAIPIPSTKISLFDALVFNGSFDQILTNPVLKKLYTEKWLNSEKFQLRAKFMLLRMHNLAEKAKRTFATDNAEMEILNRAAQGDKDALNSIKSSSSAFKKAQIPESVEVAFFKKMKMTRPSVTGASSSSTAVNVNDVYMEITGGTLPSMVDLEDAGKEMTFDLDGSSVSPLEKDSDNSMVDDFPAIPPRKKASKWKDVFEDSDDLNGADLETETQDKPRDFSVFIVLAFGVAALSSGTLYYYRRVRKSNAQISPEIEKRPEDEERNGSDESDLPPPYPADTAVSEKIALEEKFSSVASE